MEKNKTELDYIIFFARENNLSIKEESLKPFDSTGFMSKIFSVDTDRGMSIIHIISTPASEQQYQNVPEKINFVSSLLKEVSQTPTVFLTGNLPEGGYFLIQELKDGKPLGKRSYKNEEFVDEFLIDRYEPYLAELQNIILQLHGFESNKFGYLDFSKKIPEGNYDSWIEFLADNFKRNINILKTSQENNGISYFDKMSFDEIQKRIRSLFKSNKELFEIDKPRLIHGDILNYSNVLVSNKRIEGIIDFEWSLFGHPVWEFVFTQHPPMDIYIPKAIEAQIIPSDFNFQRSVELHNILWCAWGASVHADNPKFGPVLFSIFLKNLIKNT